MTDRRTFLRASATGLAALLPARLELTRALERLDSPGALRPERLREEYMLDPALLYLNHGSMGTMPRAVHEAHLRYLLACESNPHTHIWEDGFTEQVAATRAKAAALLGCATEEVAFTHNTTEAFNLLAQGLGLRAGDEVLFSSLNHASASYPWRHYGSRYGYSVRTFDVPMDRVPEMTAEEIVELYDRHVTSATRVLVFPEVDNVVGLRHPVAALGARAKERGVEFVLVDGAQIVGMLPVNVAGADAYAASPHKWLQAPKGLGLLYVRRELQERISPMWVKTPRASLPRTAQVFEDYSTRNTPEVATLGDAIDFQTRLGAEAKVTRYMQIRRWFRDAVSATPGARWRSPAREQMSASLFAIEFEGRDARVIGRRLTEQGVVVRAFGPPLNTLRVSPNLVTTEAEVRRFFASVG